MKKIHLPSLMRQTRTYRSLLTAVRTTGGCASSFTPKRLNRMSALELVKILGKNDIFFIYFGPWKTTHLAEVLGKVTRWWDIF